MGGEGVPWIGAAPFSGTKHIFANLGDGTYFHSGTLAIRAAIASKVNITYKILYNDAVAMTGGQHVDGDLPVYRVAQQVMSEGVAKCWILSEKPENYEGRFGLPENVPVLSRDQLDNIMREARETPGTTIIIYDQTCAAEKRRRRKRGKYPDPAVRVFINKDVCEGCGDCSVQSNCVAVQPVETEYGRKRKINQSACNKDYSCLKGFCPSFVTVHGGAPRKTKAESAEDIFATLPEPQVPALGAHAYNIMVTGIGGTGVLTVGALLGMAAHLEGNHARNLDMTGLAQKGGEVLSHVRLAGSEEELRTGHIITGGSDLLLACDIVSAAGKTAHETLNPERTRAVINTDSTPVAAFVLNNDINFHEAQVRKTLLESTRPDGQDFVPATSYALALMGDEIATNIFIMGFAWQKALIPLSRAAIERAIELNGVAVEDNKRAFAFGRLAAHDPAKVEELVKAAQGGVAEEEIAQTVGEIVEKRMKYLKAYQGGGLAKRYRKLVDRVAEAEKSVAGAEASALAEATARFYHKLLAYKDEYEVARLYTDGTFRRNLRAAFEGDYEIKFHMAPPIMEKPDPATGRPKKRTFGKWMYPALFMLAKFRFLRGTPLDIFGYHRDRVAERALIREYEQTVDTALHYLTAENHALCAELLSLPDMIRGYGPVKEKNIAAARARRNELIDRIAGDNIVSLRAEKRAA
jgi:indolepyruvate ferredoxin oxidoreductase